MQNTYTHLVKPSGRQPSLQWNNFLLDNWAFAPWHMPGNSSGHCVNSLAHMIYISVASKSEYN